MRRANRNVALRQLSTWAGAALAGAGLLLAAPVQAGPAAEKRVKDFELFHDAGVTEIFIEVDAPPVFQSFSKKEPPVLVVDLVGTQGAPQALPEPQGAIKALSFEDTVGRQQKKVARLTLRFTHDVRYDVTAERNIVRVRVVDVLKPAKKPVKVAKAGPVSGKPEFATDAEPVRLAQEDSAGASTDDGSGGATAMTYIGFTNQEDKSRVFARMNNKGAEFTVKKEGENLIALEIENATIPWSNNKNYLDTTFFQSPVKMITPSEVDDSPPKIRIVIEMKENVPYEEKKEGNEIVLYFKK